MTWPLYRQMLSFRRFARSQTVFSFCETNISIAEFLVVWVGDSYIYFFHIFPNKKINHLTFSCHSFTAICIRHQTLDAIRVMKSTIFPWVTFKSPLDVQTKLNSEQMSKNEYERRFWFGPMVWICACWPMRLQSTVGRQNKMQFIIILNRFVESKVYDFVFFPFFMQWQLRRFIKKCAVHSCVTTYIISESSSLSAQFAYQSPTKYERKTFVFRL